MIQVWSHHTDGPARRVVGYLLDDTVPMVVGTRRDRMVREPAPELLRGDPRIVARMIDGLETKRRYRCATMSFAKNEVDIDKWRRRDPETLCRIDAAIELWIETAYAGLAPDARPPVLVSTHLHTGRLEINLLAPSCVLVPTPSGRRIPRAYNPHPPVAASRTAWTAFEDTLNGAFGWRDPRDPRNAAPVRGPSWLERRAAAFARWIEARTGGSLNPSDTCSAVKDAAPDEDDRVQLLLAAKIRAASGAADRRALLDGLAPMLTDLGWLVDELRDGAIVLAPRDATGRMSLTLYGTLCEAAPAPPSPLVIAARKQMLDTAPQWLREAWTARAEENARTHGPEVARSDGPFDPDAILRLPAPPVVSAGLALRRLAERLFDRIAGLAGRDALTRALAGWSAGAGFAEARRSFAALATMPPIIGTPILDTAAEPPALPIQDDGPTP
ncbi:MAG: hypothetical protein AAF264_00445 [Pseudomonadota bacterium]